MADTTVKHFTSAMVGAPTVSRTAGTLIAMLDACLVDGFGLKSVDSVVVAGGIATVTVSTGHSAKTHGVALMVGATGAWTALNGEKKVITATTNTFTFDATGLGDGTATGTITTKMASAGWTKVFSGTNKAVYRSSNVASSQIYIRIDDSNVEYARPTGYLTMSDVDTGTGAFSTTYFNRAQGTAGNRSWWVAANDNFVLFGIDTNLSGVGSAVCAFGDYIPRRSGDAYRFMIAGANNPASNWGNTDKGMSPLFHPQGPLSSVTAAQLTTARSYTQLGGGVQFALQSVAGASTSSSQYLDSGSAAYVQFPNGGDNSVMFCDAYVQEQNSLAIRGRLPGAYVSPQAVRETLTNDYEVTNPPELTGRTLLWKVTGYGTGSTRGGFMLDVTGPWV
jgi:hypothetical protein